VDATHWAHHPAAAPTGHLHHLLLCLHRHSRVTALHMKHLCRHLTPLLLLLPRRDLPLIKVTLLLLLLLLYLSKELLLLLSLRNRYLHTSKSMLLWRN
jgi:hypothetical protein